MTQESMPPREVAREIVETIAAQVGQIPVSIDATGWGRKEVDEFLQGALEETETSNLSLRAIRAGASILPSLGIDPVVGAGYWKRLPVTTFPEDEKIELIFEIKPKKDTGISKLGH